MRARTPPGAPFSSILQVEFMIGVVNRTILILTRTINDQNSRKFGFVKPDPSCGAINICWHAVDMDTAAPLTCLGDIPAAV